MTSFIGGFFCIFLWKHDVQFINFCITFALNKVLIKRFTKETLVRHHHQCLHCTSNLVLEDSEI